MFDVCDLVDIVFVVLTVVLAESVFVLESFYEHPRGHISSALGRLISSPGVEIGGATIHLYALERYRKTKNHFVGCGFTATAAAQETTGDIFDQDLRKFADVRGENQQI